MKANFLKNFPLCDKLKMLIKKQGEGNGSNRRDYNNNLSK